MNGGPRHLVLGGSTGIGFAYAERCARLGHRLVVVARDAERLGTATQTLRDAGAAKVRAIGVDLANGAARRRLLDCAGAGPPFASIFVGGPGPKPGTEEQVTAADHARARDVCIHYPREALIAAERLLVPGGLLVILSSSAADESASGHGFFLSARYRREFSQSLRMVAEYRADIRVVVLKPHIVLTSLSIAFSQTIMPDRDPAEALAQHFEVASVPSPVEYLNMAL